MRLTVLLPAILILAWGCSLKPHTWPMEGTPARNQRLVVFPPVVENVPDAEIPTLQGALTGSILTHLGGSAVSSRVLWDSLAADFEGFPQQLFLAAREAFQAGKRELENREFPQKDSTLHRELDALGDRLTLSLRMLHLDITANSHLLVTGIRRFPPNIFSSRRIQVWAFVVDRERHRVALAFHMEFTAGDSLYRQAKRLLYAGRDIANLLKPWFLQMPLAPQVRVTEQPDVSEKAPTEKTEENAEE